MHLGLSRALKTPHWAFFADRDAGGRRKLFSSSMVHKRQFPQKTSNKKIPRSFMRGILWCTIGDSNPGPTD